MDCYRTVDIRRSRPRSPWFEPTTTPSPGDTSAEPKQTVPPSPVGGRWAIPATGPWVRGGSEVAWA